MSTSYAPNLMSGFLNTEINLLRDDLKRNSHVLNDLFSKLSDIEDPSLSEILDQLKSREGILAKQISALSEEKQKLKQDIARESSSLISTQRLVLITIMCTAIIVFTSVFYATELAQAQTNQILQEKSENLNIIATQLETELIKFRSIVEASSSLPQVQDVSFTNMIDKKLHGIPNDADPKKREAANDILRANKDILAVFFVLPNGDMYLSQPYHGQENMRDYNFAYRDWYSGVTKTHQTYISNLYITQITDSKAIAVATPVYSDSKYVGIWCLVLDVDYFASHLQKNSLEQNEQVVIVDKNNHIVYDSSHTDLVDEKITTLDYVNVPEGVNAEKLTNTVQTVNGIKSLVLTLPVHMGNDHWTAVLIQPYDDTFSPKHIFTESLIMVALFIAVILMIGTVIILNILRKSKQIQTHIMELGQYDKNPQTANSVAQQVVTKKVTLNKKIYVLIIIAVSLLAVNTYLVFAPQESPISLTQMKSGFVIENLRGDTVNTWTAWNLLPEKTLDIRLVNSDDVSTTQLDAIKDAILSEKSVPVDDSITHKGPKGQESLYYAGWIGALKKASEQQTKFVIPTSFHITDSSQGEGDIVFHFSKARSVDGYTGYTNSVVDQNQILKSTITIYDVDSLTPDQIGIIARHEFGHALGLAHSSAPEDLMAPIIVGPVPYISECDISAIRSLYDGNEQGQVICEK